MISPRLLLPLVCLLFGIACLPQPNKHVTYTQGAIVRGDSTKKEVALVFTADEFGEGLPHILETLKVKDVKAGFFFTGRFYRNPAFRTSIKLLEKDGHYLGPHSNEHLLYCDWSKRDSLLVTKDSFAVDLLQNIAAMESHPVYIHPSRLFIPPFEWWNDSIAAWSNALGFRLFSFSPGMRTQADYTWPGMGDRYKSNEWIFNWLRDLLHTNPRQLTGAIILIHAGTDPRRKEKLYQRLAEIIAIIKANGFVIKRIDELLP